MDPYNGEGLLSTHENSQRKNKGRASSGYTYKWFPKTPSPLKAVPDGCLIVERPAADVGDSEYLHTEYCVCLQLYPVTWKW